MDRYFINDDAQSTGEYEVHKEGCPNLNKKKEYLGLFDNCLAAVGEAKDFYLDVSSCSVCCMPCHRPRAKKKIG